MNGRKFSYKQGYNLTTQIDIAIQHALELETPDSLKNYWAGIYLSVIESLVFQNNTSIGFNQLASKKLSPTLANIKANSNINTLNNLLNTTYKNHSFEYVIRNMFNNNKYAALFQDLIDELCKINECEKRLTLQCRYFILGKDSITLHPEIDKFKFRIKTKDGWVTDKQKIKEYMRYCDAAIEVDCFKEKEYGKVLFLGEIEGQHGHKLLKTSFWVRDKMSLDNTRCYHFGIGVTPTPKDLKIAEELPKQSFKKTLVPVGKNKIVVFTYDDVTNLPSDVNYALEDLKKKFNDNEFHKPNSLFSGAFYNSIKIVTDLINTYWNENVMDLLMQLRVMSSNSSRTLDASIQVVHNGLHTYQHKTLGYVIPPLAGTDIFFNFAKAIESQYKNKDDSDGENISVSSVFSGNFLFPRKVGQDKS